MKIERAQIVDVALQLVSENGLESLKMRTIAERLGVQASALYWHIGGKSELLATVAHGFYVAAVSEAARAEDWRGWLLAFGNAFRRTLLGHRDSAMICLMADAIGEGLVDVAELTRPLEKLGLDAKTAILFEGSVIALALGWVAHEQSKYLHDRIASLLDFDETFTIGIEAMIAGFRYPPVVVSSQPG